MEIDDILRLEAEAGSRRPAVDIGDDHTRRIERHAQFIGHTRRKVFHDRTGKGRASADRALIARLVSGARARASVICCSRPFSHDRQVDRPAEAGRRQSIEKRIRMFDRDAIDGGDDLARLEAGLGRRAIRRRPWRSSAPRALSRPSASATSEVTGIEARTDIGPLEAT